MTININVYEGNDNRQTNSNSTASNSALDLSTSNGNGNGYGNDKKFVPEVPAAVFDGILTVGMRDGTGLPFYSSLAPLKANLTDRSDPRNYENGFDADYIKIVAQYMASYLNTDIDVKIINLDSNNAEVRWKTLLLQTLPSYPTGSFFGNYVNDRIYDVQLGNMSSNATREAVMDFVNHINVSVGILQKNPNTSFNFNAVGQKGGSTGTNVARITTYLPLATAISYATTDLAIADMLAGTIDFVVMESPKVALAVTKQAVIDPLTPFYQNVATVGPIDHQNIYFKKNSPVLKTAIQKAVDSMKLDGTTDKLIAHHGQTGSIIAQ
jgi:ABC-type amino acid transport substrate-binding protein